MLDKNILSDKILALKPSPTIALTSKVADLKKQGVKLIGLTAGEPDFNTPDHVIDAAFKAAKEGKTKYTPSNGVPEIRAAIQKTVKEDYGINIEENQIAIACGGKGLLFNVLLSLLNEGDEVIIPAPYWVSYPDMVALCGGKAKVIATSQQNNFLISAEDLSANITNKTKILILNSPSNPSGAVYSRDHLNELVKVLEKHPNVFVISDDVYQHLVWDGNFTSITSLASKELLSRIITVNALSKSFAMTGWRIGWSFSDPTIAKALTSLASQSFTHPTSFVQYGAAAALNGDKSFLKEWGKHFVERRDILLKALQSIDGIECLSPAGAFYLFPKVEGLLGKKTKEGKELKNDSDVAEFFLTEAKVAGVPGKAFGLEPYVRFSYATSTDDVRKAGDLLVDACATLK